MSQKLANNKHEDDGTVLFLNYFTHEIDLYFKKGKRKRVLPRDPPHKCMCPQPVYTNLKSGRVSTQIDMETPALPSEIPM